MPIERTVVVAGATGRLGGVVDQLLARGHRVLALTRDPEAEAAARLRDAGAEVRFGDFDDPGTIAAVAAGADALFATGTAHRAGPDGELRHGIGIADAAAAAGVGQLVYVSGDGASPHSELPLMRAKFAVEEHIRSRVSRHTILAPVYLMENLFNPWNLPALRTHVLPSPVPVGVRLQQVALADVVAMGVLAIERPAEFVGMRVRLASDEVTASEAAAAIARVTGIAFTPQLLDLGSLPPGLRALFGWLARVGHDVDLGALRDRYPEVGWHDFDAWADAVRDRLRALCPHTEEAVH
jgi:uncharacterized protein YbjT (DUF2867 family)